MFELECKRMAGRSSVTRSVRFHIAVHVLSGGEPNTVLTKLWSREESSDTLNISVISDQGAKHPLTKPVMFLLWTVKHILTVSDTSSFGREGGSE